jgi:hypothetical protein
VEPSLAAQKIQIGLSELCRPARPLGDEQRNATQEPDHADQASEHAVSMVRRPSRGSCEPLYLDFSELEDRCGDPLRRSGARTEGRCQDHRLRALGENNPAKSGRVMQTTLLMTKIDIARLEAAAAGG